MGQLSYRKGSSIDVAPAAELFVTAMTDLMRRNGIDPGSTDPRAIQPWYHHLHDTGIFEVAMEDDTMIAFASGVVRDDLFFLSMFWTHPERQRKGVGRPLIARVWGEAEKRGAKVFSVWSSIDFAALGIYLKLGMRPVGPLLTFSGAPRAVEAAPAEVVPLEAAVASNVDQAVRGTGRPIDHAFFAREKKHSKLVCRGAQTLGYFYAHEGRIGPVAWLDDRDGRSVLAAAIDAAKSDAAEVTLAIPGPNRVALDVVVDAGLPIVGSSHFLTSAPFGALERYVPSGPALF